ncbi:MAG: hypothetical protein KJN82_01980, partial [Bacteroidia bacterium]|nr:hypothetical protein [Bacteroidia bacterium]
YKHTFGPAILVNLDTSGTLKQMHYISDNKVYQDSDKEKGSFKMFYSGDGIKLFYNKGSFTISSFYSEDKLTYPSLKAYRPNGSSTYPLLVPHSVKLVPNHNMMYFISKYNSEYWFHRLTW